MGCTFALPARLTSTGLVPVVAEHLLVPRHLQARPWGCHAAVRVGEGFGSVVKVRSKHITGVRAKWPTKAAPRAGTERNLVLGRRRRLRGVGICEHRLVGG